MPQVSYTSKSESELSKLLVEKKLELGKILFTRRDQSQKLNYALAKLLRRDIARIQTALNSIASL